jgi:hypothetical protein
MTHVQNRNKKRHDEEEIVRAARNTRSLNTLGRRLKRYKYGNAEVERELITLLVRRLYPDECGPGVPLEPKPAQVEVLRKLIIHKKSAGLIAKTGFVKSLILQAVSAILENIITIVIVPLNRIGEEQVVDTDVLAEVKCNAPQITGDTSRILTDKFDKITEGEYIHIFISPELALSSNFRKIVTSEGFENGWLWWGEMRSTWSNCGVQSFDKSMLSCISCGIELAVTKLFLRLSLVFPSSQNTESYLFLFRLANSIAS